MATGRPYGIGIYGTGRYGNGPAAVAYAVAAQSQIAFSLVSAVNTVYAVHSRTKTKLLPQAAFIRITQPAAATQIASASRSGRTSFIRWPRGRRSASASGGNW